MTTMAQLARANLLNIELGQVTAALAAISQPGVTVNSTLELQFIGPPGTNRDGSASDQSVSPPFRVNVSPSVNAITALLTNRQTALQNALALLGITS